MNQTEYQQIMDRLEGRMLCYGNVAARCKGGPKQYTKAQLESAKAKAIEEARIIVWTFHEPPTCSNCDSIMPPPTPPDRCGMCGCPAEHQRAKLWPCVCGKPRGKEADLLCGDCWDKIPVAKLQGFARLDTDTEEYTLAAEQILRIAQRNLGQNVQADLPATVEPDSKKDVNAG